MKQLLMEMHSGFHWTSIKTYWRFKLISRAPSMSLLRTFEANARFRKMELLCVPQSNLRVYENWSIFSFFFFFWFINGARNVWFFVSSNEKKWFSNRNSNLFSFELVQSPNFKKDQVIFSKLTNREKCLGSNHDLMVLLPGPPASQPPVMAAWLSFD